MFGPHRIGVLRRHNTELRCDGSVSRLTPNSSRPSNHSDGLGDSKPNNDSRTVLLSTFRASRIGSTGQLVSEQDNKDRVLLATSRSG